MALVGWESITLAEKFSRRISHFIFNWESVSAFGQVNFLATSALEIRVDCQELHDLNLNVVPCTSMYIK